MSPVRFALTIVGKLPPKTKRAGNRVARGRGARSFFLPFCEVSKSAVVKHVESIVKKLAKLV